MWLKYVRKINIAFDYYRMKKENIKIAYKLIHKYQWPRLKSSIVPYLNKTFPKFCKERNHAKNQNRQIVCELTQL